jgi:hypothetical protein
MSDWGETIDRSGSKGSIPNLPDTTIQLDSNIEKSGLPSETLLGPITADSFKGTTDNVPEGSVNFYFTPSRGRAILGSSGPISYNPTTGIIGIDGGYKGKATLSGGTVTINTDKVLADSIILITPQNDGANVGFVWISARTPGASFTIKSSNSSDTRDIGYLIL